MLNILQGDAIECLKTLPDECVQCCVTSPPYFGLRDYGTATWEGGNPECEHKQGRNGAGRADGVVDDRWQRNRDGVGAMGGDCKQCGAVRIDKQLGLESTPYEYVSKLVSVFQEVWRVLKPDGTLWLNLGDSYASSGGHFENALNGSKQYSNRGSNHQSRNPPLGLKPKDLIMIPARVAIALQDDGWWIRSDIIWFKTNPMPESVTDRPTRSHEYVFLCSKNEQYFFDSCAIMEPSTYAGPNGRVKSPNVQGFAMRTKELLRQDKQSGHGRRYAGFNGRWNSEYESFTRNKRSVWTVPTMPFSEAHFATFPPDLIRPMIMAGSRIGDTVLDPFFGSGTTGMVALELGRKCIGVELNKEYVEMANRRCNVTIGML